MHGPAGKHPFLDLPSLNAAAALPPNDCGPNAEAQAACAAARDSLASPRVPQIGSPQWNQTCTGCPPAGRFYSAITYDAADGYVLLFGGLTASITEPGDTWTYKAGVWTNITATACTPECPSPRFGSGMTYDPRDGYVVLFGGAEYWTNTYYSDTWVFAAGSWTEFAPSLYPYARYYPSMTFDAADNYVLLFGGASDTAVPLEDTWQYHGGQWYLISLNGGPSSREGAGMTYDAADGYVVLFGGLASSTYYSDTWEFFGGSWSQLSPTTSPGSRALINYQMAYDSSLRAVVLFAGETHVSPTDCDDDTWTFSGGQWTMVSPLASPTARLGGGMVDDPPDGTLMLFSGYQCSSLSTPSDTWTYYPGFPGLNGTLTATPSTTDVGGTVTFTVNSYGGFPPRSYNLHYGDGGTSSAASSTHTYAAAGTYVAWLWVNDSSGGSVTATATVTINALPTSAAFATPNPADVGATVAFSPNIMGGTGPFTTHWTFGDGTSSASMSPTHAYSAAGSYPVHFWSNDSLGYPAASGFTMVVNNLPSVSATGTLNPVDARVPVKFTATASGGTGSLTLAWNFGDGTTGTGASPSHAYATKGNYTAVVWANDSGGGSAHTTVMVRVNPPLVLSGIQANPSSTDVGIPVQFSALSWGGTPNFADSWRFGDGGTSLLNTPSHAFGAPGNFTVQLWINDSGGGTATTSLVYSVDSVLHLASFTGNFSATSPGMLDLGEPLETTVVAYGGSLPLSYSYFGLPGGCSSLDASHLNCTPTATGAFTVEVQVTDNGGQSAFANLSVTINAALSLPSLSSDRSQVSVGAGAVFDATPTGGTSPFTYAYTGLPAGCSSANSPTLTCFPSASAPSPSPYAVSVDVTDATGAQVTATATLTVNFDPSVTFAADPANSSVGSSIAWVITVSGGTGPFTYTFTGLPPGCATPTASGGSCKLSDEGTYQVSLTVRDADGREANATAVLHVAAGPALFFVVFEQNWWIWILVAAVAAILLYLVIDRRHRKRTQLATGEEIHGIAPSPEGHALIDDLNPPPPGAVRGGMAVSPALLEDTQAPEVGIHPEGYEAEPEVSPPPQASEAPRSTSPAPDTGTKASAEGNAPAETPVKWVAVPISPPGSSIGTPPSPPASPAPEAAPASEEPPPHPTPKEVAPAAATSEAAPPSLPGEAQAPVHAPPTACMICNAPLDGAHYCAACHVTWS